MEEGLDEVRGVLIGTPPEIGNYLTMADLNKLRGAGPKRSYEQLAHTENALGDLLRGKRPPNLVILMKDSGLIQLPPINARDTEAAFEFVRRGGRLIVLDDWGGYGGLVVPFTEGERAAARPAPDPKLRGRVLELVKLLDSDTFKVREKATADLRKLGKEIVPVLEEAEPTSLEVAMRVRALLREFRPPPAPLPQIAGDANDWFAELVRRARKAHGNAELRPILRNAGQQPGQALCVRLAPRGKGE
jgi:hypothetical protein